MKKFQITKPIEQNTGQAESAALRHAIDFFACPQPGQAGTKKNSGLPGNSKLQIPNYKQIPNPKSQITKQKKVEKKNLSVNRQY